MKIKRMDRFILIFMVVSITFAETFVTYIEDERQIEVVRQVDIKLRNFVNEIKECMKTTGRLSRQCMCYYRNEFEGLRRAYKKAIDTYPEWKDKYIGWRTEGREYFVSFPALRRQLHINEMLCGW